MNSSVNPDRGEPREIQVIPVNGFRNRDGEFEHRVPPVSQTTKAQKNLGELAGVVLSDSHIERLTYLATDPQELEHSQVVKHRTPFGWLSMMNFRAYAPMLSPAAENDRLLADASYSADPNANRGRLALSMPAPHDRYATLVHSDAFEAVMEAVDRAAIAVQKDNPQDIGERIVESALTVVPATFTGFPGQPGEDYTAVDGNCRLNSCLVLLPVERGWLTGDARDHTRLRLLPSYLMRLPLVVRRELVRKIVKAATKRLAQLRTGTETDLRERNEAAIALNAITVPVQMIVGFEDDDPLRGMQRFPAAVRSVLVQMNVSPKKFSDGSQHAVMAEEIVTALHDEGLLDGEQPSAELATARRDVLIGRGQVPEAMGLLGLDGLPDLRFARVVQEFTRRGSAFNHVVRSQLGKTGLYLSYRNGPVVELGLRSYSASIEAKALDSIRKALDTGCLWQDLVDTEWTVENAATDDAIDGLRDRAHAGDTQAALMLGVLGMVALVLTGHLRAAGGSAEETVGTTIARTSVGQIIKGLLETEPGREILADAVKRSRAGSPLRWWDSESKSLVELPSDWATSTFNAFLRQAVRHGFISEAERNNPAAQEAARLTRFQEAVSTAKDRLMDLIDIRDENGTVDKIAWLEVEPTFAILAGITARLGKIAEPEPLSDSW
ncbi:hypothetical protein ACIQ9P_26475 [Kitasatospora sp. NPDC094019]|uniref:hypothetical protein n=1 Tax=Kitasatospora sp. NPDC094019 TaxID=3364091 RepID=UPI0037F6C15A